MPIAILEIPRDTVRSEINISQAKEFCDRAVDRLHGALKVPDPKDKESRIIRSGLGEGILRMAFTIGPNEYPDFKLKSFFPTKEQIESAGKSVLLMAKESRLGISQVVVEAWKDTTFMVREKEMSKPVAPVSEEELKEIGSQMSNPRMRLILSPQKQEGSFSKEDSAFSESENYREAVLKLSKRMAEILGWKEAITTEVEVAESADTNVSVEFDCETEPNNTIPQEARQYMAESVLHILDLSQSTKEGSGEVWIRQGQPVRYIFK